MKAKLIFKDGTSIEGSSFGADVSVAGEVVFATGMVGYPEAITDPSFSGQILIFTYPLIGSYGVPDKKYWESNGIKVAALVVSNYIDTPSHHRSKRALHEWFKAENIPLIEIKDTRLLTKKIRREGDMLGKIVIDREIDFRDPNRENLISQVSIKAPLRQGFPPSHKATEWHSEGQGKTIVLIDCGAKNYISRSLLNRGVKVITVPWNFDIFSLKEKIDGVLISNGPGDPKMAVETIEMVKRILKAKIPTLGICMGNQILARAAGGNTRKLKYGHRSQNQPCIEVGTTRCYLTTQNHGYVVTRVPQGFKPWFINVNDNTNEGIIHQKLPFMSVQFHPEATPGPTDTEWIFDYFLKRI